MPMPSPEHQPLPGDTPAYSIVLTTVATEAQAELLARQIVESRLGACVQLQPLKSFYRWKGDVCIEPEWQLSIKTRRDRFVALAQFIATHHAYETPEIVQIPISAGSAAYLAWVDEQTRD